MQKLRGSGTTFSTSGRPWLPFQFNPHAARRFQRLHRLMQTGKLQPATKAEMRAACDAAVKERDKASASVEADVIETTRSD